MERVKYLDFIRGLAIFFMVMQHAMLMYEYSAGNSDNLLSVIFVLLGTWPAAPVFMLVMGVFMARSKSSTKQMMIRGLKLFIFGYILNFLRFTIPLLIGGEKALSTELLFEVDVFQLSGLSFILLAPIKHFSKNNYIYPIIIVVIMIISPYLWGNYNYLTDPFIGSASYVSFPVFPFIIYPMLGMYLSPWLLNMNGRIFKNMIIASILLTLIGVFLINPTTSFDYPKYTIDMNLLVIAFTMIWSLMGYMVSKKFREFKLLSIWSKNITEIYILQWLIYGYGILVLGANGLNALICTIIGIFVMVITHILITKTKLTKYMPKL